MSENTTELSYWLNWRFLLCALIVLFNILLALFLIWRYEGEGGTSRRSNDGVGVLNEDEAWKTCLRWINPAWLLGFRLVSFILLLSLIVANTVADTGAIFYYYTQWTFSLITLYFGFASAFSIYGCWRYNYFYQTASFWRYLLQIIYQIGAGALVMTDVVFWLIIYPFLRDIDFKMDCYMFIMHSVNVILIGDAILNCMNFPMFRFGYFILWSTVYIIFQWIIHACISFWWPYKFLDLSSSFAPLWYLGMTIIHIPCYGLFALIIKLKQWWLSRSCPDSYQGTR